MRRLVIALTVALALPLVVSAREKRFGYCQAQNTGARVLTCTVTVYQTGTLNLATIYQDNVGTPKANPFTASSTSGLWFFYADNGRLDVKFSGGAPTISPAYTLSDLLFLDLGDITTVLSAQSFQSTSANIAQTGTLRLASADTVNWRNAANNADLSLNKLTAAVGNVPTDTLSYSGAGLYMLFYASATGGGAAAAAGALRLAPTDVVAWRNTAGTADLTLNKLTAATGNVPVDTLSYSGPGLYNFFYASATGGGAAASSGILRLASTDSICWRNNVGTADSCMGKNVSDALAFTNLTFSSVTTSSANPATSGFIRLANLDAISSRNAGNTLDLPIVQTDGSDNVILTPGPSSAVWLRTDTVTLGSSTPNVTFQLNQSHVFGEGFIFRANNGSINDQLGGSIALIAGNGITSGTGGSVLLTPGSSDSGSRGIVRIGALDVFASLPACSAGTEGGLLPISDSTTTTWGATITGGGSNHVLAYCDGTVWSVAAK